MAKIAIFRINYKSDFILTLNSDAGWMTPFCIKFWTGAPSQAYFVGFDGTTYTHCAPVDGEPTKLLVQFDDHHLPIGDLKFQIGYHFTVADFPTSIEDEVINQAAVIIDNDGEQQQVMLDFTGETAPEIEFSLPAYANEAQRIANEAQRIANEEQRIATETQRIANEEQRISQEQTRQQNEVQRIVQEQARVTAERERFNDYAKLKVDAIAATDAANSAAALANEKAQLAADKAALAQSASALATEKAQLATDKAALAQSAATLANDKAALAQQKAEYATAQGDYAKAQGDYAKAQGDYAKAQAGVIPTDVTRTQTDATFVNGNHDPLFYLRQANSSLAGLMTAADYTKLNDMPSAQEVNAGLAYDVSVLHPTSGVNGGSTYASLSAALAVIPQDKRKGGMTVKFVLSSDNKYVQYRLMSTSFSTTESDWQGVDETPTAGSQNLVTSGGVDKELNGTDNFTVGGYINQDGYTITPNSNYAYSDYFDITPGTTVKFNKASGTDVNVYALMYKSDGSTDYWTIDTGSTYRSVSVPAGFIKARFSFKKTSAANASVGDNIIWEKTHTNGINDNVEELISNTVKVTAQSLTDEQKTQAKANLGLPPAVDNYPIAGSNNLVKSSGVFDENNKLWKSITEVNGHIPVEFYQGNTDTTGKPQSNNIRVSTMPFLCTGKVKVSCGGDVGIGYTYRYKTLDVFVNGGTLNVDFIEHSATSAERAEIIIDENTDFPYCLVVFWDKNDNTAAISVADVESSGTAISSMDNSIQNIEDVLDGVDKIINLGTITKSDRVFAIWFDNPVDIDDYSNISIETTRLDSNTTSLYIYALYSNVTTDRQELLPKIEASVKSMRNVPKDVSDSSHAIKKITGLYIYNPEDISYSFEARVLLSAKDKSYSRLSVAGVSANFASIPAYYHANDYLWKKMKIINSYLRSSILTGDAFYFVTDTHWEVNQKHSPALIQELNKKLNIQRIFHGGDVYHNGEIIDNYEVDCINSYRKAIGKDNVYACSGNHEFLSGDTYGDVYVETGMHLNDVTFGGTNKQYYYSDNKAKKIRYIILYGFGVRINGNYTYGFDDAEQLNWFEDIALDVETGWDIIIFTHYVASPSNSSNTYEYIGYYNNFKDIVNNYNGNGRIVSIITGHTHRDFVVLDRTKVPIIVTTCDHNAFLDNSFENLTVPRTSGTINEQAFDVVIYDKENVLMHFVRIGSQAYNKLNLSETNQQVDCRSIYCEPLVVGNTKTLPTYLTGTLTWASSDSEVASVNNGVVTAVAAGYVRIDVTDASGIQSFFMEIK